MDIYDCVKLDKTPEDFWIYVGIMAGVALLALIVLLAFAICARKLANGVKLKFSEGKEVEVNGPMVGAVVFVLGLAAIIWGLSYVRGQLIENYRVKLILENAPETLSSVKELLTTVKEGQIDVVIDPSVANFAIQGRYDSTCIADFWQRVCSKYNAELRCNDILKERTVKITRKSTPNAD
ncbi:hypothetical protein [Paraburkholderia sp.]|uniref:hypothetical protein n=1 Tax=Paraburkholderia sp. TaxID=1926495 RepID=UPI0039E28E92